MKVTPDQLFSLSKTLRDLSVAIGNYRFANWGSLTGKQRASLEAAEWSLLNASSDVTTIAVGLVLDESQWAFDKLNGLIQKANQTLKTLAEVRQAINIATAAVGLAGAIISKNPAAIGQQAKNLYEVIQGDAKGKGKA